MEKFMRRIAGQLRRGVGGNGGAIHVLHPAAAEIVPYVKQKKIFPERRPAPQRNFIIDNALQRFQKPRAVAGIAVNDNPNRSSTRFRAKLVEMADFHWRVDERVVARGNV